MAWRALLPGIIGWLISRNHQKPAVFFKKDGKGLKSMAQGKKLPRLQ